MLQRNLLIPILMIIVIGAPIVYHEMEGRSSDQAANGANDFNGLPTRSPFPNSVTPAAPTASNLGPFQLPNSNALPSRNVSKTHIVPMEPPFQMAGFPRPSGAQVNDLTFSPAQHRSQPPAQQPASALRPMAQPQIQLPYLPRNPAESSPLLPFDAQLSPAAISPAQFPTVSMNTPVLHQPPELDFSQLTPDYGAAETIIFPGNEFGPDLTAQPLENLPVPDFAEIFRFDLTKSWVQTRWKRISTNPIDYDSQLSGMRIPLVTGTNSWDLHGSLTYYFDSQQQVQRITFRGWTGDPQKLLRLLMSQYQFKAQPTHLAGFYLAQSRRRTSGGLMMKTPAVIDADNSLQQYGIVMEINRPDGTHELSEDFRRLIAGSHAN